MKINAVKLMRDLRDNISKDINNMSWKEEREYLKKHNKNFEYLITKINIPHFSDGNNPKYDKK